MSFQNSAGGIVLDAVLTDVGRKRMAQGNFNVSKFALGDDEIDYSLLGLITGSAVSYQETNILQTPILEALGGQESNINFGLQNFIREDIMYMPQLRVNHLLVGDSAAINIGATLPWSDGFYHLSVNKETSRKLLTDLGDAKYILENNRVEVNKIVIESGIHTLDDPAPADEILPTLINKERFLVNMGLYDKYFTAYADNRFIDHFYTSKDSQSHFETDEANNLYADLEPLYETVEVSLDAPGEFYNSYIIVATDNAVITDPNATFDTSTYSCISGPRSSIFAFNVGVKNELCASSTNSTDFRYTKFGKTSSTVFAGSSNLYDFIDTTIYIQALSSDARITIPLRIIRYAGT